MIVVFYEPLPDDLTSGPIISCCEAPESVIAAWGKPFVIVHERRADWDVTHEVAAGEVVPKAEAVIAEEQLTLAMAQLRMLRNSLLRKVDQVGPARWNTLGSADQAQLVAYREALLDWPVVETDALNPTPPTPPAFLA